MQNIGKLVVLGAALAVSASSAFASTILTGGLTVQGIDGLQDSFTSTSIMFNPTAPSNNAKITGVTGNLAAVAGVADFGVMTNFTSTTPSGFTLFTDSTNASGLSFTETGISVFNVIISGNTGGLTVLGTGFFSDKIGDTPAFGSFSLSSNGDSCGSGGCPAAGNIGFTFTPSAFPASPTPEPSSLMLLGTGLVSAAGVMFRRRATV